VRTSEEGPSPRERFERLYVETRIGVLGYLIRRAANPSDAADLLAETYVIAWRKIEDVPRDATARLWLYGVARHVLSNYHRHARVERSLLDTLRSELSVESAPYRQAADGPFSEVIAESLGAMDPLDREILALSAWEQLTPTEIAEVVGLRPGTVRVRLHRARKVLQADLREANYPRSGRMDCAG
jgi:RNA polymerase sigma factor (sigma-70 family)